MQKKYNQNFLTIRDFESPSDYNIYLENIEEIVYNHINKKNQEKNDNLMKLMKPFEDIAKPKITEEERIKAFHHYICEDFKRVKKRKTQTETLIYQRGQGLISGAELIERGTQIENKYRTEEKKKIDYTPLLKLSSQQKEIETTYKPRLQSRSKGEEFPQPLPNYQKPTVVTDEEKRKRIRAGGYDTTDYRKRLVVEAFSSIFVSME